MNFFFTKKKNLLPCERMNRRASLLAASGNAASHCSCMLKHTRRCNVGLTRRSGSRHPRQASSEARKHQRAALSALSSNQLSVIPISNVCTAGPVHETRHGADGCSPLPSCFRELFRTDALSGLGWDLNLKPTPGAWPYGTGTRPNILNTGTSFHFKFV